MKSNRRAIERPFSLGEESLRFKILFLAFAVGAMSTLPSTSSKGRSTSVAHFGSLEGWDGYGRAKKYGWCNA